MGPYVVSFRNEADSETSGVEDRGSRPDFTFLSPCKTRGGVGDDEWDDRVNLMYLCTCSIHLMGGCCAVWKITGPPKDQQ